MWTILIHSAALSNGWSISTQPNVFISYTRKDGSDEADQLYTELHQQGIHLITKLKANMKNKLMLMTDKLLLRKRSIIETINDQLKNISQIEPSRHRSPINLLVNLISGLIAYTHQPKKLSLQFSSFPRLVRISYP